MPWIRANSTTQQSSFKSRWVRLPRLKFVDVWHSTRVKWENRVFPPTVNAWASHVWWTHVYNMVSAWRLPDLLQKRPRLWLLALPHPTLHRLINLPAKLWAIYFQIDFKVHSIVMRAQLSFSVLSIALLSLFGIAQLRRLQTSSENVARSLKEPAPVPAHSKRKTSPPLLVTCDGDKVGYIGECLK